MKPHVICHMLSPLDGRVVVDQYSNSPQGSRDDYVALYFGIEKAFAGDGYIVGRATMEPYAKGEPRPPQASDQAARPIHRANPDAAYMAIVLDPSGKLHWGEGALNGDHLVIVVGPDISDSYLCELAERGLSYIVAETADINPGRLLQTLNGAFGAKRIMVEGGGIVNGRFLAAGLVDEISIVLVPAIDGTSGTRSIFEGGETGLAGKLALRFKSAEPLTGGALHLRYSVEAPIADR